MTGTIIFSAVAAIMVWMTAGETNKYWRIIGIASIIINIGLAFYWGLTDLAR